MAGGIIVQKLHIHVKRVSYKFYMDISFQNRNSKNSFQEALFSFAWTQIILFYVLAIIYSAHRNVTILHPKIIKFS